MLRGQSRKSGFTLIELLVVIAIIAILAAILFPVFAQAREAARKASCTSNLKQLATGMTMYRSDYDGRFPFGGWFNYAGASGGEWHNSIYPYIKNKGVYLCPSSTDIHDMQNEAQGWNRTATDYIYNNLLAANRDPLNESAVNAPADCVMVLEGHSDWGNEGSCQPGWASAPVTNNYWCREYTTFGNDGRLVIGTWNGNNHVWGLTRHNRGANVSFVDGHVKFIQGMDSNNANAAESLRILESRLPWMRHMKPQQSAGNGTQDSWNVP